MAVAFISKTTLPKALKFATGGNLVLPLRYVQLRWNPLRQRIREVTFVLQRRQRNDTTFFFVLRLYQRPLQAANPDLRNAAAKPLLNSNSS